VWPPGPEPNAFEGTLVPAGDGTRTYETADARSESTTDARVDPDRLRRRHRSRAKRIERREVEEAIANSRRAVS
jgi:hypothetical protein